MPAAIFKGNLLPKIPGLGRLSNYRHGTTSIIMIDGMQAMGHEVKSHRRSKRSRLYGGIARFHHGAGIRRPNTINYAFTGTETSSGVQRDVWRDLMASSAVNLPINKASLRLDVVSMGVRSIRCTKTKLPPRFNFTRNLVFFMVNNIVREVAEQLSRPMLFD